MDDETVLTVPPPDRSARVRHAARVLLLDDRDRVLLLEACDPHSGARSWHVVGGGVDPGESHRSAAVRELAEEIGLVADPASLTGPVWSRHTVFTFAGVLLDQRETFYALRVPSHEVDLAGMSEWERATTTRHRWWSVEELGEAVDTVYPTALGKLLPEVLAGAWSGPPRTVNE